MTRSQLEIIIEKATNENNVTEDWGLIMDIVDQINQTSSEKEAIKIITKRLNDRDPHVISHTLTLLNACVKNCSRNFKLAVCSGVFIEELKHFVLRRKFYKLSDKLATMIQTWSNETEFKEDPALNLIPSLFLELKRAGVEFITDEKNMKSTLLTSTANSQIKKEEEDLARAIQLSIKECTPQSSKHSSSNLKNSNKQQELSENEKVKALYDFEAVEENEITFKAGDILLVTDSSDQNWWKGFDKNGIEGLFPSNFVTSDLAYEIETFDTIGSDKKVSFNNTVNVKELANEVEEINRYDQIVINEKKIDECIDQLQNADPTGETQPDSQEMLNLEDECYMMGPLIDQQLQKIDYKHATLEDLNLKILEAFQMYNNLMKDSLSKSNSFLGISNSLYSVGDMAMANNLINPMNSAQTNTIPFVAAPPPGEASPRVIANQLNNFASNSYRSMPTTASSVGLTNFIQSYNPYTSYNLPNEQSNVNQTVANSIVGVPLANSNSLPLVTANGMNYGMMSDGSYQQNSLSFNPSVQYGQPS